jgi:hypothetical protein
VTFAESNVFYEGLVEDGGENLLSESGDSGGPWLFINGSKEALMEGTFTGDLSVCVELEKELNGKQFFKTRTECANAAQFLEEAGNKGIWERKEYECIKVANQKGAKFFKTAKECKEGTKAGEGEFERTPELHVVYQPLKQPVKGAAEGSLENLKLELLTTANEAIGPVILPTLTAEEKWTGESGKGTLEKLKGASNVECTKDKSEGTFEAEKPLGKFHIDFEGCKAAGISTCTGLGEAKGVILALGTFHLVFDKLGKVLSEAGLGVLFLPEPIHFECSVVNALFVVEGQLLCLMKPANSKVKHFEIVCEKGKEAGDPGETVYWNLAGTEVKMGEELFLTHENGGAGVMSSENMTELILTTNNLEIMT